MRGLIVVIILCLTSMPAFACVLDNDCANKPGTICVDGDCIGTSVGDDADNAQDNTPVQGAGKRCYDDRDCSHGAKCLKGSSYKGVCIGH